MGKATDFKPKHFKWEVQGKVATVTLNRPERKNPLTFESYAELKPKFYLHDALLKGARADIQPLPDQPRDRLAAVHRQAEIAG